MNLRVISSHILSTFLSLRLHCLQGLLSSLLKLVLSRMTIFISAYFMWLEEGCLAENVYEDMAVKAMKALSRGRGNRLKFQSEL